MVRLYLLVSFCSQLIELSYALVQHCWLTKFNWFWYFACAVLHRKGTLLLSSLYVYYIKQHVLHQIFCLASCVGTSIICFLVTCSATMVANMMYESDIQIGMQWWKLLWLFATSSKIKLYALTAQCGLAGNEFMSTSIPSI